MRTELSIEVLTPEGWKQARLSVAPRKDAPLGLGFKIEFEGKAIAMSMMPVEAFTLVKTLCEYFRDQGLSP